jgi:hypothetical protein
MRQAPDPGEVRVFRAPRWLVIAAILSAVMFAAVAYVSHRFNGLSWVTVTLLALIPIGVAGVADALTQRIELHREHIVVVRNLRRRAYPRNLFVKVAWAKGVPVSLQSSSGQWIHLPDVATTPQGLVNTLRAWLKT